MKKPDPYIYDEAKDADWWINLDPDSLTAKKLERIGTDISERKIWAERVLEEYEQPIQSI